MAGLTNDTADAPSPITSGRIDSLEASDPTAVGSPLAQTTTAESLEATASQTWNSLTFPALMRHQAASLVDNPPSTENTYGQDPDTMGIGSGYTAPTTPPGLPPVPPEVANALAKGGGATLTPFTAPVGQNALQGMIDDNVKAQKSADVISRSAAGIFASPARFATGALVSLADPLNDMAMMIPGPGEAFVAARIEAAGGGILARTGIRAAAGAAQGAAGMAALQPLAYAQAQQDHEDYGWGDALRQVLFGAALGAGSGALHGLLSRAAPEVTGDTMQAALAPILRDDPRGVDVEPILAQAEAGQATPITPPRLTLHETAVGGPEEDLEGFGPGDHKLDIHDAEGNTVGSAIVHYNADEKTLRVNSLGTTEYMSDLNTDAATSANAFGTRDMLALRNQLQEMFPDAEKITGNRISGANPDRELMMNLKAQQSARDMATRAMNPTDPELVRTQRIADNTIATAPVLEGVADKDAAEVQKMAADKRAEYEGHVAAGRIVESPTAAEAGQEHIMAGKAKAAFAACDGGF